MTIKSFFSKIGNGISNVAHTIGSTIGDGYKDIKNVVSGVGTGIKTQLDNVHTTVNNVIQDASGIVNNVIKTGSNIVQHTEDNFKSIISTPLLLIAAGIGGLLLFNGKEVVQVGGQIATRV